MDYNNFCAFLPSDATHSAVMRLHVVRLSVTFRYRVQIGFDFALTYSFQGTHILGALRSHLCDSVIFLLVRERSALADPYCQSAWNSVCWFASAQL